MRRRLAPRVRPHPPRGPGARRGRMGPERPVGGNCVQARGFKRECVFFLAFYRGITYKCAVPRVFKIIRPTLEVSAKFVRPTLGVPAVGFQPGCTNYTDARRS
eukprot:gene25873-biopygen22520